MTDRPGWSRLSLRARLTLVATLIVTLLLFGGGLFLIRDSRAALERSLDAQVAGVAREVAGQLQGGTEPSAVVVRPGTGPFPQPAIQIRDPRGDLVASITEGFTSESGNRPPVLLDTGPAIRLGPIPPPEPAPPIPSLHRLGGASGWSVTRLGVQRAGRSYVVLAGAPYSVVRPVLAPLEDRLRLAIPVVGVVTALLAYFLARRALRPVELIRAEAESVTESSLSRRVPEPRADDEVGRLARTFNAMLARLQAGQLRQRQFVSDASHELRSPVAILRSSLEVAAAHPGSTDWPAMVDDLLAVTGRLERLVDDLLLLARQGEAGVVLPTEQVDLDEVVRDEVRMRAAAPLVLAHVDAARVIGSRHDLSHAIANLLDNAARHAASRVEVTLRRDGALAVLCVDDDGPGIPPCDRDRVFERFVRLDPGRGRDAGGAGLGLAVVRETVRLYGGVATVTDSALGGARLVLKFPLVA